jgi:lipoate-protein ligase A
MKENPENLPPARWRLLISPPGTGPWNMAVDTAVLKTSSEGNPPPTLRFYRWTPPCLSLGINQPLQDVDQQALDKLGWDLVRRPTGGRAILHTDELTYSVIGPKDEPRLSGGVMRSYRLLSSALFAGLKHLGLPVQVQEEKSPGAASKEPICFENPSDYEITFQGKKLLGSAQARKMGGVLQHGTLPLSGDITRITRVLQFPNEKTRTEASQRMKDRSTTVKEILGREVSFQEAQKTLQRGFQEQLNLSFERRTLTSRELTLAKQYYQEYLEPLS